jgi:hypothetical protein
MIKNSLGNGPNIIDVNVQGLDFTTSMTRYGRILIPEGEWLLSGAVYVQSGAQPASMHANLSTSDGGSGGVSGVSKFYAAVATNGAGNIVFPPFKIKVTGASVYYYMNVSVSLNTTASLCAVSMLAQKLQG